MSISHAPIIIPKTFVSDHPTAGLDGYPAIDVFGPHDHLVVLRDYGTVSRISGKSPCRGGKPGGAAGWSIYVDADDGCRWFLTHFGALVVRVGSRITPAMFLGVPLDARDGPPGWSEHIHAGKRAA